MIVGNELFVKVLEHEKIKDVPLLYVIVVFSAIQEILEQDKTEEEMMERS